MSRLFIVPVLVWFSASATKANEPWRVEQLPTTGYAQHPFTDGRTVVWSDEAGVHKWRDGVKETLAQSGRLPVVYGDTFAWITRDAGLDRLVYDDGSGPQVVFSSQPSTTPVPYVASLPERPSLVGNQLAFNYSSATSSNSFHYRIALIAQGQLIEDIDPLFDSTAWANSNFPSTNGTHVVWTTERDLQEQVFQWTANSRSEISVAIDRGNSWAIATDSYAFYTSPLSANSSQVVRYSFNTGTHETVGEASSVDPRTTWAAANRVIFTDTSGDLVLWDSGATRSLSSGSATAGVARETVAWAEYRNAQADIFAYDGTDTVLLGTYASGLFGPELAVSDTLIAWGVDGELFLATAVPEPLSLVTSGAAFLSLCVILRRSLRRS